VTLTEFELTFPFPRSSFWFHHHLPPFVPSSNPSLQLQYPSTLILHPLLHRTRRFHPHLPPLFFLFERQRQGQSERLPQRRCKRLLGSSSHHHHPRQTIFPSLLPRRLHLFHFHRRLLSHASQRAQRRRICCQACRDAGGRQGRGLQVLRAAVRRRRAKSEGEERACFWLRDCGGSG
jgi:hypothetical protein